MFQKLALGNVTAHYRIKAPSYLW